MYVKLLETNVCNGDTVPSVRTIQYALTNLRGMKHKITFSPDSTNM